MADTDELEPAGEIEEDGAEQEENELVDDEVAENAEQEATEHAEHAGHEAAEHAEQETAEHDEPAVAVEPEGTDAEEAAAFDGSDIPEEEQADFRQFFHLLSKGRGYIEGREVRLLMEALGQEFSSQDAVQGLMEQRGLHADSQLSLAETVALISGVYQQRSQVLESLMNSFRFFDKDGSGYLERQELHRVLFLIGNSVPEEGARKDLDKLMQLADKNGDGRIDYAEFCQLMTMGFHDLRNQLEEEM